MFYRRLIPIILAALILAGCEGQTTPSNSSKPSAEQTIGSQVTNESQPSGQDAAQQSSQLTDQVSAEPQPRDTARLQDAVKSSGFPPADTLGDDKYDLRVLFIGNSYTYHNDLPQIFQALAASGGKEIYQQSSTEGGYTLTQHGSSADAVGKISLASIMDDSPGWDYVVLQEQSVLPVGDYDSFADGVSGLASAVRDADAQPVLYMTWGRQDSFELMNPMLEEAYINAAGETDSLVVPVGSVWGMVWENDEELAQKLWYDDGSHPSYMGSYLNACVFYAAFFGESPVGLWFDEKEISSEDAGRMQKFATEYFGL